MAIQTEKLPLAKTNVAPSSPARLRGMTEPQSNSETQLDSAFRSGVRSVTRDQRQIMISEAAYYLAEHRGFEVGHELDDWLVAETQIDAALGRRELRGPRP